ncbi:DUF1330 domain-containing protein [Pseudoalteromonas rubra]|uniref:DUF1330 domain-containing protein n=1 Tax=Pseudoalteromonas rubra TaxID=43658 RepID=A0A5S3V3V8_9GAMM|nr:DUF1330 domain-containing protein [Pseudoalteromonas rubra]QPB83487.1 DUF1330 domain-containing protein [Pseudoalteromonas rubra]
MKGYLILDFSITDFPRFKKYIKEIPEFIKKHGGRYVVQGVEPEVMEGDWHPERVVVLEFPNKDVAKEFLADPDAQPLFAIRHSTTKSKLILVEGCC